MGRRGVGGCVRGWRPHWPRGGGSGRKTKAAVLWELGKNWEIAELDLDPPKQGEVLIRYVAAGLCHSDEHLRHGDIVPRFPLVGGHEGAGIIEEVGPGVSRVKPGDHVVCSFIPSCGFCRWCSTGQQNLCDLGATILEGCMPDGTFRFHSGDNDLGAMCMIGTFSQWGTISETSCVKVDDDLDLETVVLVGCGVPTGWGSAVYAAEVGPGDTVAIYGLADPMKQTIHLSGAVMTLFQKTVKGTLFGNSNPMRDITKMLDLYRAGDIKLDELVTKQYKLDEINQGYDDLIAGKNIRGVIIHEH